MRRVVVLSLAFLSAACGARTELTAVMIDGGAGGAPSTGGAPTSGGSGGATASCTGLTPLAPVLRVASPSGFFPRFAVSSDDEEEVSVVYQNNSTQTPDGQKLVVAWDDDVHQNLDREVRIARLDCTQ